MSEIFEAKSPERLNDHSMVVAFQRQNGSTAGGGQSIERQSGADSAASRTADQTDFRPHQSGYKGYPKEEDTLKAPGAPANSGGQTHDSMPFSRNLNDGELKKNRNDSGPKDGSSDSKGSLDRISGEIGKRVEERLKSGDPVPPVGESTSPDERAKKLTKGLVDDEIFGLYRFKNEQMSYEPNKQAQGDYPKRTREATKELDRQEADIAKKMWDGLDETTRKAIMAEQEGQLYMPREGRNTPNTDKFREQLAEKLKPFEEQREKIHRNVWENLPDEQKREILFHEQMRGGRRTKAVLEGAAFV